MKLRFATLFLVALLPGFAQTAGTILSPNPLQSAAVANLVAGFNDIGGHASELSRAMSPNDAAAFDALVEDVGSALLALPGIAPRNPDHPGTIVPKARYARIGQLAPDLNGLEKF